MEKSKLFQPQLRLNSNINFDQFSYLHKAPFTITSFKSSITSIQGTIFFTSLATNNSSVNFEY